MAEDSQTLVGGYSKVSTDDAKVKSAADFAVMEESKKGPKITLKSISTAETQVVAGMNYKLVMVVDEGGTEKTVEAVIYEDLQHSMSVTSWTTM
ncbi:MAG: cystatin domain-containing protein [Planctomycetaceae bacterium]